MIDWGDTMKKIGLLMAVLCILSACGNKQESMVCTLDIKSSQDEVTLYSNDGKTLSKEIELIDINFDENQKETMLEIAKENESLFSFPGVTYSYNIKNSTFTSTLTIDYTKVSFTTLEHTLGLLTSSFNEEKDAINFKKRVEELYTRGYTCK